MKKRLSILTALALAAVLAVSALPKNVARADVTWYINVLQTDDSRVKLREKPNADDPSNILLECYAGTPVKMLRTGVSPVAGTEKNDFRDDWAWVEIGGVTGFMMTWYLSPKAQCEPTRGLLVPKSGYRRVLVNANGKLEDVSEEYVDVYGTIAGEQTLLIAVHTDAGLDYRKIPTDEVYWTGDMAQATIRALTGQDPVRVASSLEDKGDVIFTLFPGTVVYRVFDNHLATNGFVRIRLGDVAGYVREAYVDPTSGGIPLYRPMPVRLTASAAQTRGSERKTIFQGDPLFVLGRYTADENTYYCMGCGWDEKGENYELYTCLLDGSVIPKGADQGVSTKGTLKEKTPLYQPDGQGAMQAQEDVFPEGVELRIAGGLNEELRGPEYLPEIQDMMEGYLAEDTVWLKVELRKPYQYRGMTGYVPISAVDFDRHLILPGMWTRDLVNGIPARVR